MQDLPPHPSAEALLAHADWVRALARTLVRDPGGADDVAQASWLDVLERPPGDARNLRGWLAQVVRSAAGQRARAAARREAREQAVARPEALPDTAELVAQAERQREVVGHVLALAEPYRTAVLLRYFLGLEARAIAARQEVPLATVRTRLQRALAQLRERLDREYGDRASWCAALVTLADGRATSTAWVSTSSLSIGVSAMAMAWKVGAAVLVVGATWWAWRTAAQEGEGPRAALVASGEAAELVPAPSAPELAQPDGEPLPGNRTPLPGGAPSARPASPELAARKVTRVEGRIVDAWGQPVGGLRIVAFGRVPDGSAPAEPAGPRVHATTAVDGSYALDVPGWFIHVESADEAWILTCEGLPVGQSEQVRVAMPALAIEGIVVDEAGAPVADASVDLGFSCSALKEFPLVLYGVESKTWTTLSEADGSFRFTRIPAHSEIRVTREGYEAARARDLEPYTRIVLHAAQPRESPWIRGLVLDERGAPVAGADVRFGQDEATSDERGRFELAVTSPVTSLADAAPLTATKVGLAAAVLEGFGRTVREDPAGLEGLVLRMGGAALAITGRVLDAEGKPCRGWWIDVADGTPAGTSSLSVERESAGGARQLETDADGRFRLGGLRERTYRVRAFDPSRCLFVVSEPTAAGTEDLVLREPRDAFLPLLRGRVVSQRGRPIAGAVVRLMFTAQVLPSGGELMYSCREAQADDQGRFEFADLPREHVYLRIDGPHVESAESFPIPAAGEVELRASVLCRFRVDVRPDDPADRFRVLDGDGRELRITTQTAHVNALHDSVRRRDDGFPVCIVGEEAATLVLYQGELELRRVALDLQPSELQIVTP